MSFEKIFSLLSYAAVFCGFFCLWISGTFGIPITVVFVGIMLAAWGLEGSRWQISERLGTVLIVLSLPVYFLFGRFEIVSLYGSESQIAGVLARMILTLSSIKLLQKKSDRDWIFLYLMSFFEVLLAAALSISALFFGSFLVYLLAMVCGIIAFEIRKTSHAVDRSLAKERSAGKLPAGSAQHLSVPRLPATAVTIILLISALAVPLFFMLPRVGSAGLSGGRHETTSGFSDKVTLGNFGRIQESDEVVMRVRLEGIGKFITALYFRGVAFDTFDNRSWSASGLRREPIPRGEGDVYDVASPSAGADLLTQTVYLEPLDAAVLFGVPSILSVDGNFPSLKKDEYGSLRLSRMNDRISYVVRSDISEPTAAELRADDQAYTTDVQRYRDLPPVYDIRIAKLAETVMSNSKNRYDKAKAVESYLRNNYGYSLEQKPSGPEPLADFLFNAREGHCEYFASAMAVMLRTQGIATRVVNGYRGGDYNDAADMTVVRQRNAHSWVEVYFPKENAWIRFDPTPAGPSGAFGGITGRVNKYFEALEMYWIEYFVAFDYQGQRSLYRSARTGLIDYQARLSTALSDLQEILLSWWRQLRGDQGIASRLTAAGYALAASTLAALGFLLFRFVLIWIRRTRFWRRLWGRGTEDERMSVVEFYERMQSILSLKGIIRQPFQTPQEFAAATGLPGALRLTEIYHDVRFGTKKLSDEESEEVNTWLADLEKDLREA